MVDDVQPLSRRHGTDHLAGTSGQHMSSVRVAFGIASLDEQDCSNFRPFSCLLGTATSLLRTVPFGTNTASTGSRSGLPAPLNRLDRKSRPALLPGPAAPLSIICMAGSRAGGEAPALLRRLAGKRQLKGPPISLASDKRHIRFWRHCHCLPDAPRPSPSAGFTGLVTVLRRPQGTASGPERNVLNSSR
jgi:hypothetical protein